MKNEETKTFKSTGREIEFAFGIIGLSEDLEISEGYDGKKHIDDDEEDPFDSLKKSEALEICDIMIERWNKLRNELLIK